MMFRLLYGLVSTLLLIVLYKMILPFVVTFTGDFVYTLILLITPAVLYITLRKMVVHYWNYRLPFLSMMLLGLTSTVLAGIGIGLVDYFVLSNGLTLFGEVSEEPFAVSLSPFLYGYLTWYFFLGIITTPILYGVLWFQLHRR